MLRFIFNMLKTNIYCANIYIYNRDWRLKGPNAIVLFLTGMYLRPVYNDWRRPIWLFFQPIKSFYKDDHQLAMNSRPKYSMPVCLLLLPQYA